MPRAAALAVLSRVLDKHRPLDEALAETDRLDALNGRDRAFARLLVATVLRRKGQIDALLDACLDRPLARKARQVRHVLALGAAQLLFLETAPHAAVSTAVDLCRGRDLAGFKGLVNGVLRRLDREGRAWLAEQDAPRLNTPDWLWASWTAAHGAETARAIAMAHLGEPPLDLTVKHGQAETWAARLEAQILPTGSLRLYPRGPVTALAGFDDGAWWVQDAAAALPARLLGPDLTGQHVADLCAAPGGKTAQLVDAGARVTAVDRSAGRLARLTENLARLGMSAGTVAADAATWTPPQPLDAVLLDAPCSATGTLRRHPDAAWGRGPDDVAALARAQDRLLDAAIAMVRPGGLVVYCTCSLQPQEGPERIDALLARAGDAVARVPVTADAVPDLAEALTPAGDLRTLPSHWAARGGLDGFFAARLRRKG